MESSTSRPVLLKAGIPLALTVAGFICARIIANRSVSPKQSSLEADDEEVSSLETNNCHKFRDEDSFNSFNSTCMLPMEANVMPKKPELEEEISCLRSRLDGLQNREAKLEMQFIRYCELKEQESVVMELKNMLLLEMTRVEFLDREVSSMEAESRRLEKLVGEYVRVLVQLEDWKSENGLLERKIKKLLRKGRKQSRIIREQDSMLAAREAEVLRINGALQTSTNVVKKLDDEIGELKMGLDQTQEEKREILQKLELAEKSVSLIPKIEKEEAEIEDYNRLKNELQKLQKDHAAELKELINLRWSNACLKQAYQEQAGRENYGILEIDFEGSKEIENYGVEHELAGMVSEQNEPCFGIVTNNEACSKRRKLFQRLKRWVEGSDKGRRHEEVKCFGRHSASDDALEHQHHQARRSCSSA